MDKPEKLFHASPSTNVVEFEPRNEHPRYPGEPSAIFATPHQELAAMFLSPRNIRTEIGVYGDRYAIFINCSLKEYSKQDKGGAIYTLPADTFETDTIHGMGSVEWYSRVPVKPITKVKYQTSLDAMDEFKVDRFFVDGDTFEKISTNPSDALKLVE